jgi:predicted nucleotidyltransferase
VLTGEDQDGSDLDILVDPTPETSIFDIGEIRYQLRELLGVPADVLTPNALHAGLREHVLSEAMPV